MLRQNIWGDRDRNIPPKGSVPAPYWVPVPDSKTEDTMGFGGDMPRVCVMIMAQELKSGERGFSIGLK